MAQERGTFPFGKKDSRLGVTAPECIRRFRRAMQDGDAKPPRLLRGLEQNFFPARGAFCGRRNQALLAPCRRQRKDFIGAQLGGFLKGPLHAVIFHDGQQQRDVHARLADRNLLEQRKFDGVAAHVFRAREPDGLPIAQLVELARLRAEHAAQMVSRIAAQNGCAILKLPHKESPPHRALCYINRMRYALDKGCLRRAHLRARIAALLVVIFGCASLHAQSQPCAAPASVIVDTDAGSDDLMAFAFLLSRPEIRIEAVTVANGLAHVDAGARNVSRLLKLAGRDVPVFRGRGTPLSGHAEFPAEWRKISDTLPGVQLPELESKLSETPAAEFLAQRLARAKNPVCVLALGPLTNLAGAFEREPSAARHIGELVIMGGAVHVPGNLGDGGYFKTKNTTAEWNIFVDPTAAKIVFGSGAPIRLVPLDATQKVPIGRDFLDEVTSGAKTPLAKFVAEVLASDHEAIDRGIFYAWDPLAAAVLVDPTLATYDRGRIEIQFSPMDRGRTAEIPSGKPNAEIAVDAGAGRFRALFLSTLGVH